MNTDRTIPKDILAELIGFIADREPFHSVQKELGGDMTVDQVRDALRELSFELKRESIAESSFCSDSGEDVRVSSQVQNVLSCLSTQEEKKLLRAFGFEEGS